nr:MAG: hypothetical protein AM325_12500 [Candidatus Thorarchaeota archaeon SMTZ1-45]
MNAKRILQRAFLLLFVIWILDFVNVMTLITRIDETLSSFMALNEIKGFLLMVILGLLVQEVSKIR